MRWAGAATSVQLQQQRSWQIPPPCCVAAGTRGTQRLQWRLGAASLLVQPLPLPRMACGPCRVAATGEGSTPPGTWQRRDDTSISNSPASHHHHHQQQQQQQQQQPAPSPLRGTGPSAAAVETLRTVLPVSAGEARLLLLHRPELGLLPRQRLADGWQALQRALPLPAPMLLRAAHQQPQLLEAPSAVLAQRLADAASTLRLPRNALRSKAPRRTPMLHCTLLLLPRSQLEARVGCLSDALGCSVRQADLARLLCDEPRLLEVGQAQLLSTVQALEQICGVRVARLLSSLREEPRLLVAPAERLHASAAALQRLLRLSPQGLALALRRAPGALLAPQQQAPALVRELSTSLGTSPEVAADIMLQEPALLARSSGAVGSVLGVLRSAFKLGPEGLLQVVEYDPSLLLSHPGQLSASVSRFQAAAARVREWDAEYRRLMARPVNVARSLRIEPLRLARLTYLLRSRAAGRISLKAAVSMSGRQFLAAFPGYGPWLAAHYSGGGGVPRQYRPATAADGRIPNRRRGGRSNRHEEEEDEDEEDEDEEDGGEEEEEEEEEEDGGEDDEEEEDEAIDCDDDGDTNEEDQNDGEL